MLHLYKIAIHQFVEPSSGVIMSRIAKVNVGICLSRIKWSGQAVITDIKDGSSEAPPSMYISGQVDCSSRRPRGGVVYLTSPHNVTALPLRFPNTLLFLKMLLLDPLLFPFQVTCQKRLFRHRHIEEPQAMYYHHSLCARRIGIAYRIRCI